MKTVWVMIMICEFMAQIAADAIFMMTCMLHYCSSCLENSLFPSFNCKSGKYFVYIGNRARENSTWKYVLRIAGKTEWRYELWMTHNSHSAADAISMMICMRHYSSCCYVNSSATNLSVCWGYVDIWQNLRVHWYVATIVGSQLKRNHLHPTW